VGNDTDGTKAWYFIPRVLKNGATAPAVIFLHGHTALDPAIYQGHIQHLVKQGYIVIYPVYQRSDENAQWEDLDQNVMLARAVASTAAALEALGPVVARDSLVIYGHSLGGLFAFCWQGAGGAAAQRIVMSHANMDPATGIPWFVIGLVTRIDYAHEKYGPAVTVPVIMLWGDEDTDLAPLSQQQEAYNLMTSTPSKVLYAARSDNHGQPDLAAAHGAATQLADGTTGRINEDALDFRYYYAALDAALDNQTAADFDMGTWSDGKPVNAVLQKLP
jgi:pimeloyl-ACP methyl ester carboxylesterase